MTTYEEEEKVTMMGNTITEFSLLEKFNFDKESLIMIQAPEFWGTFYRHNNYFYDKNKSLIKRIRPEWATKGIERKISMIQGGGGLDDEDIKFFSTVLDQEEGILSRWGVRASSLNDIIRYMIYFRFKLDVINKVGKEITEKYEMDKELAYKVFKETEDEFTIRDYVKMSTKEGKVGEVIGKREEVFKRVIPYLEPKEALEMILMSKEIYEGNKEALYSHVLRNFDLENETRIPIWKCLIPKVIYKLYLK